MRLKTLTCKICKASFVPDSGMQKISSVCYNCSIKLKGGNNQMASLKEFAQAYEPEQTKNIAELEIVSTDLEIKDDSFTVHDEKTDEDREVKIKVVEIDGERYRVPVSVINQLKTHLEENPKLKKFRVKKSGEGLKTNYTVIPLA